MNKVGNSMRTPYVSRRDISLSEDRDYTEEHGRLIPTRSQWFAYLDGRLSTGERVQLKRSGTTFSEALADIETAIAELGWEIR